MNVTMPHLIAKQMCGCVQLRHHCAVSVAKKMIFEIDAELAFDLTGGVFERIDRLDSAVWQTIHQICGGNFLSVQIINKPPLLFAQDGKLHFIFCPLPSFFLQMLFERGTEIDCPF